MPARNTLTNRFADRLRKDLYAGRWSSNRPLPSERVLAERYKISRVTVRRSLKLLCRERLIEVRPARGYFVLPGASGAGETSAGRAVLFVQRGVRDRPTLDSLHTSIVNGALAEAHAEGLEVYILCQHLPDFRRTLREQWGERLRGVLLDWARPDLAATLIEEEIPFVVVETDIEGLAVTSVIQDNAGGVRQALKHLHERGHRRIALILAEEDSVHARQRLGAYREFLLCAGLPPNPAWVARETLDEAGGRRAAAALLESAGERPTAVLAAHREMLPGVAAELAARGLSWPRDVSLVVWGEPEPGEPGGEIDDVTHVAWSKEAMGRLAVRALEERIKAGRPERLVMRIEARLVDRGSVGAPAAGRS